MEEVSHSPEGWAKNLAIITKLVAENELLALRLADAEAQLRLYRAELHNAEMLRRQLMNETSGMRYRSTSNTPAIVIPIREVVA